MTLCLGLKSNRGITLLSDTRISHPDVTQVEELPGRLKIVTLRPDLCVAYAGSANRAIDSIRQVSRHERLSAATAAEELCRTNVSSNGAVDFLIGSLDPVPNLLIVKGGRVDTADAEVWIGDAEGAERYTRAKAAIQVAVGAEEYAAISRCIDAFQVVLNDLTVPTVAGLQLRVGSSSRGFVYRSEACAYMPNQTIPSGQETVLHFGGAAEGGFAYSILTSDEPGVPIIAVHFYQGRIGYVYAPLEVDRPVAVRNVTHDGLREYVLDRFDANVQGPSIG